MQLAGLDVLEAAKIHHADAEPALDAWRAIVAAARWKNLIDVRRSLPMADGVKIASGVIITVFNIKGNRYRLVSSDVTRLKSLSSECS